MGSLAESSCVNLLALDTSTEVFFLAVQRGAQQPWERQGAGAAAVSATLIPAIQALLAQGGLRLAELDAIVFGRGPGSFTGIRSACSVAQGLAFASAVPVLPVDTLMAVAEDARGRTGATRVVALLDARMDEVYSAAYAWDGAGWQQQGTFDLGRPEALVVPEGWSLAGNAFAAYGERWPAGPRIAAQPTAAALLRLAPALIAAGGAVPAAQALPLYIRDKVAQTTEERATARRLAATP